MLDDGWKATEAVPVVELEPEFVEVHGNGNDVEAVVVNTNYNGHYGELAEGQQSLPPGTNSWPRNRLSAREGVGGRGTLIHSTVEGHRSFYDGLPSPGYVCGLFVCLRIQTPSTPNFLNPLITSSAISRQWSTKSGDM